MFFLLALLGALVGVAGAQSTFVLMEEDFEGLTLGPNVDEGVAGTAVWTNVTPPGWFNDATGVPGYGDPATDGVTEWAGWGFADKDWWAQTAGDQRRTEFTLGQGTVAIADPDEWADSEPVPAKGEKFNSVLVSPPVPLPDGEETLIVFDSHYRQERPQKAEFRVSINGGPDQILLRYSSSGKDDNAGRDAVNQRVHVTLPAQPSGSTVVMKWALLDGNNNWFWAIDNVALYRSVKKAVGVK